MELNRKEKKKRENMAFNFVFILDSSFISFLYDMLDIDESSSLKISGRNVQLIVKLRCVLKDWIKDAYLAGSHIKHDVHNVAGT